MLSAALGALTASGVVRLWMVFAFAVAFGAANAADAPARQVYVLELVGADRLANAVSLNEVVLNASRVLGPAVGGVLLVTAGVSACFFVNAATFLPPLVVLLMYRSTASVNAKAARTAGPRPGSGRPALRMGNAGHPRVPDHGGRIGHAVQPRRLAAVAGNQGLAARRGRLWAVNGDLRGGRHPRGAASGRFGRNASLPYHSPARSPDGAVDHRYRRSARRRNGDGGTRHDGLPVDLVDLSGQCPGPNTGRASMRGRVMGIWTMALPGATPVTSPLVGWVAGSIGPVRDSAWPASHSWRPLAPAAHAFRHRSTQSPESDGELAA